MTSNHTALLAIPLLWWTTTCGQTPAVRLGVLAMLSGPNAANGEDMVAAVRLAVDRVNSAGGVRLRGGRARVEVVVEDDAAGPQEAMAAAARLVYRERVVALIGPQFSSHAIPVARLAEEQSVLMLAPMSTHPETTAGKRYVFRIPYLDTFQGAALARFAREQLSAPTAAILYDVADDYPRALAEAFRSAFVARGGRVVAVETYTSDRAEDFSAQLARIARSDPHVLLLPNYSADVCRQAEQARSAGVRAVLLGGDGWDPMEAARRPAFEGSFYATPWRPETSGERASRFVAEYQQAYGRPPLDVAATTYDAVSMFVHAMERAGETGAEALRRAILELSPYEGVTGSIRYGDCGDPERSVVIVSVRDGAVLPFAVVEP